jgi:hypothetical protein
MESQEFEESGGRRWSPVSGYYPRVHARELKNTTVKKLLTKVLIVYFANLS